MTPLRAAAVYHDGRNNIQCNYAGPLSRVVESFHEEMKQRGVVWGRVFAERDGTPLASYHKDSGLERLV